MKFVVFENIISIFNFFIQYKILIKKFIKKTNL